MILEICVALLAIAQIDGVILPLSSGCGVGAIQTRLADADAKALFTADGFFRRDKIAELKSTADQAIAQVPTIEHVIVLRRTGHEIEMEPERDQWWHDLIPQHSDQAEPEPTAAEDTLMLIYTSGTTGKPKGAVHTHCGFPVKAAQDMAFGTDVHPGDVIYWMSDMGWMMSPWLIFGATAVVYDGAPDFPKPDRLWQFFTKHRINQLGISPTLIRALIQYGDDMVHAHNLSSNG